MSKRASKLTECVYTFLFAFSFEVNSNYDNDEKNRNEKITAHNKWLCKFIWKLHQEHYIELKIRLFHCVHIYLPASTIYFPFLLLSFFLSPYIFNVYFSPTGIALFPSLFIHFFCSYSHSDLDSAILKKIPSNAKM